MKWSENSTLLRTLPFYSKTAAGNGAFSNKDADDGGFVEFRQWSFCRFTNENELNGFNKESVSPPVWNKKNAEPKFTAAKIPLNFSANWK